MNELLDGKGYLIYLCPPRASVHAWHIVGFRRCLLSRLSGWAGGMDSGPGRQMNER